ncbi:26S proteasome non-ATPase regulatory subunit 4 [Bactrocera neohumeralis]|uniref:26S proteasome non-ATPase regulatory subunit 4 n=1 Tax=Bactrocera tryoni TaxID=59916 RepID=UPI001A997B4B|nr:26S proteasome non-ATPase regulatory subunit 4 [Bactrocera tryoni]XP_050336157.1 26S proteasome non-ATPase regulatory subunit 4 [Bactrocera neohumeralis]
MVLESTMICFDNSDYQRNGDYFPTRLNVQKDGINLVCLTKVRSNPENNVGLMTISNTVEVLATLTSDVGRIFSKMHLIQPKGEINLLTGIRIAHLVLKHRQGKNHKMRIVVFVGSPINNEEGELVKQAKRLKKEKVNVDIVSFGDHGNNNEILTAFVNALNGKDGTGSHLVSVPRGSGLSDALLSSPIIQGEDGMGGAGLSGAGYEFGVDPNEDPELALALRVSMEEQRQRQEEEQRRALSESNTAGNTEANAGSATTDTEKTSTNVGTALEEPNSEEAMLQRALALSTETPEDNLPDFANMTEEEQIAFAMQMSMQDAADETVTQQAKRPKTEENQPMDVDEDYSEVIGDPAFLQSVLENLPGVDPQSEAVRDAVGSLSKEKEKDKKSDDGDQSQ